MTGRYLTGAELVGQRCQGGLPELPQGSGNKDEDPDGSWLQKRKAELFHDERRSVLMEERIQVKGSLTAAVWRPDHHKVELTSKPFHQFWKVMGHHQGGTQWLYPEEALFLIDEGVLEVSYGGVPWSVQQAYMTILGSHVPVDYYQVYSHLCRLGYIVQRHTPKSTSKDKQPAHHSKGQKRKMTPSNEKPETNSKKQALSSETDSQHQDDTDIPDCDRITPGSTSCEVNTSVESSSQNDSTRTWFPTLHPTSDSPPSHQHVSSNPMVNQPAVHFPSLTDEDNNVIVLQAPHTSLLPPGVELTETSYTYLCGPRRNVNQSQDELEFSNDIVREKSSARDWHQWKEEQRKGVELRGSPADVLWTGSVKPLMKPSQLNTQESIINQLRITPNANGDISDSCPRSTQSIAYDVYLPNANFKKTNPGAPDIHVCVNRQADMVPDLCDIVGLQSQCQDGVALQWAVVDNGDIAFYSFNNVSLPTILS